MSPEQVIQQARNKLDNAVSHFESELKKLRTGRAHPGMLDGVAAEAYGQQMPLIQLATITTPEPQLIQVSPFDPNNLEAITSAIRDNRSLGLNPMDDGRVVRVPIPQLTTERRQQIVKQLGEKVEECMIAMRSARHDALHALNQAKKGKDIGENEHSRYSQQIDELMSKHRAKVDDIAKTKETGIMSV